MVLIYFQSIVSIFKHGPERVNDFASPLIINLLRRDLCC